MANGRILIRIGNNDDKIIDALIREIDNIELSSYPTVDEFLAKQSNSNLYGNDFVFQGISSVQAMKR